jgi:hypothetical protein
MSFSNANTGDAPADPYKKANAEEVPLQTKIEDLVHFITKEKFGMMTTRGSGSGNLVSRCMALAATVCVPFIGIETLSDLIVGDWRYRPSLPHQHGVWQDRRPRC